METAGSLCDWCTVYAPQEVCCLSDLPSARYLSKWAHHGKERERERKLETLFSKHPAEPAGFRKSSVAILKLETFFFIILSWFFHSNVCMQETAQKPLKEKFIWE